MALTVTDDDGEEDPFSTGVYVNEITPFVNVKTDKSEYKAEEVMRTSITLRNPTSMDKNVYLFWEFGIPEYSWESQVMLVPFALPAGFEQTYIFPWKLPGIGFSFNRKSWREFLILMKRHGT